MTDKNLLEVNSSNAQNPFIDDKKIMSSIDQKPFKQPEISFAPTEINSNKRIDIAHNFTPKKKPKFSKIEAIKTFCRIRPIKGINELFSISQKDDRILNINSSNLAKLNVGNNLKLINSYKFSKVFGENSTQEEVFEVTCKPLIDDLIQNNKSGLILTYGMTNAGKTFTVLGTPDKPGILPRTLKALLEYNEQKNIKDNNNIYNNFYCNFVEIYVEDVFDLLADNIIEKNKYFKKKLNVKENINNMFFMQDVTYVKLDNLESFNNILKKGISKKVTSLNQKLSRSHTIFKIILLNNNKDISKIDFSTEKLISLSVVDLAGSERQKRTDAKGRNPQKACKINQSLSTLGKCLEAMKHNSISNVNKMVSLRESILTKILSEYFQGGQNIIMITNINPRVEDFEETIRDLNFSCIAKNIKPIKSVIPKLNSNNELKIQFEKEKEKKSIESMNSINNNINGVNDGNICNNNLTEKKNNFGQKKNEKLNDSITFNLNELFDTNSNFDDININLTDNELKTKFTPPPEDNTSINNTIGKLIEEVKQLREKVNEVKFDNSEIKKLNNSQIQLNAQSKASKNILFNKSKNNYLNNNINPFSGKSTIEDNDEEIFNNFFNCNNSIFYQENKYLYPKTNYTQNIWNQSQQNNLYPINSNMNNMFVPYGNYIYPYNNPFIPFNEQNVYNSPFLPFTEPQNYNIGQYAKVEKGKKNKKKNHKINGMPNSAYNNMLPGFQNRANLIFNNSKFGNLIPGQPIQEETSGISDSDDDSEPKKRKVKRTPKRKKQTIENKKKVLKYYGKAKNLAPRKMYPKVRNYNRDFDLK